MKLRVLHVGAHEDLVMNYYRNFTSGDVRFDYVLRRGGRDFRYSSDPAFDGRLHYLTPLSQSRSTWMKELRALVMQGTYSHVHLHAGWANLLGLWATLSSPTIRISHSHSHYPVPTLAVRARNEAARQGIARLSHVRLACSDAAGAQMFGKSHYEVLPNVIEYSKFRFQREARARVRRNFGITDDDFVLGHVGQFIQPKNQELLVDATADLIVAGYPVKLLLVGSGDETRAQVARRSAERGVQSAVTFAGERTDVSALLSGMDVFAFPSSFEGFGMALLEAQVNGLRSLYSNVIPRDAVISSEATPLTIQHGATDWSAAVRYLMLRPDALEDRERRSWGAPTTFDAPANAWRLENIYLESPASVNAASRRTANP